MSIFFLPIDIRSIDVPLPVSLTNRNISFNEEKHHELIFLGLDRHSKPISVRVVDYSTSCYVVLPDVVDGMPFEWNDRNASLVIKSIKTSLRARTDGGGNKLDPDSEDHGPINHAFIRRELFYDYKVSKDPTVPVLALFFKSLDALNHAKNFFHRKNVDMKFLRRKIELRFLEWDVSPVRKFLSSKGATHCQWLEATVGQGCDTVQLSESPLSKFYNGCEYVVSWRDIVAVDLDVSLQWDVYPWVLSFDIETYSSNHLQFPQATKATDVVYLNAIVYQQYKHPSTRRIFITYFGDEELVLKGEGSKYKSIKASAIGELDIGSVKEEAILIHVTSEGQLGRVFISLIALLRPQIITGYNIYNFDNRYLDTRMQSFGFDHSDKSMSVVTQLSWSQEAETFGGTFSSLNSRNKYYKGTTVMYDEEWNSSGAGDNVITYLTIPGIVTLDMYPWTKSQKPRLDLYSLDFVSNTILGRGKHPVKAQEQFAIYDMYCHKTKGYEDAMERLIDYCKEDATLVLDLFEHPELDVWINVLEMSRATGVSILEVVTRGQSMKIESLVYDACFRHDPPYIVDFKNEESNSGVDESFKGGYVGTEDGMKPGLYDKCFVFDYSSLYPSIMRRFNLCQSTLVPPHKYSLVDREKCNIKTIERIDGTTSEVWFIKEEHKKGIIPDILKQLTDKRTAARALLKTEKNPAIRKALDCRQLKLKIVSNSFFGTWGVTFENARLPLNEGAQFVTSKGQEIIIDTGRFLKEKGCTVVYGDTDSSFNTRSDLSIKELIPFARQMEKEVSALFGDPLKVELEKIAEMLLVTKKKYAYLPYDINPSSPTYGELLPTSCIVTKGLTSARRDNCKHQRETFDKVKTLVLTRAHWQVTLDVIIESIVKMVRGDLDWQEYQLVRTMGKNYKQATYMLAVFRDCLTSRGRKPIPGERLAYVVVNPSIEINDKEDEKLKLGQKMRLVEEFMPTDSNEEIDIMYYIRSNMQKCLEQLWALAYKSMLQPWENQHRERLFKAVLEDLVKAGFSKEINVPLMQVKREFNVLASSPTYDATIDTSLLPIYFNTVNLIWSVVKPPSQKTGAPKVIDTRSKRQKDLKTALEKSRVNHITGKYVFHITLDSHPIKMMVNALKRDKAKGNGSTELFDQVVVSLASKELAEKLGYVVVIEDNKK